VILQTPVYNCFFSSVRNNGCEVVENKLRYKLNSLENGETSIYYEMDYEDLEAKAADPRAKLLVLCNPHNPVGRVWKRDELERVADICRRHQVIVVSDEIHNELTFCGRRYTAYGTVDMENAIICTSPSKSFNTAGLQIANIICKHASWRERIDRAININEVCDVNPFGVVALQAAYNEGEPWLEALCDYLWQNYQALCRFFADRLPQLTVTPLEGTYLVWVDIRKTGLTSDELTRRLLEEGRVQVNSGTRYGAEAGEGFIRLNIACPRSQMMEGLQRIEKVINR
jgi:cystathionine beta-lyase